MTIDISSLAPQFPPADSLTTEQKVNIMYDLVTQTVSQLNAIMASPMAQAMFQGMLP
jgi:hypothetical protein